VILDAGTGIRELGLDLLGRPEAAEGIRGDVFLTHAHWDHIQGIPFFAPIFGRGNHFTIHGSRALERSVDRVVRDQMSPVVFPVTFEELAATVDFREVAAEERFQGDGYVVEPFGVRHPGGALGFRLRETDEAGGLVYVPDNEICEAARYESSPDWRRRFIAWMRGARVLVHDTMFTSDEYGQHRGWGHSTYDEAVEVALEAEVERLVLFHHRPERTDEDVDRWLDHCRQVVSRRGGNLEVFAAAEGMRFDA
jgi:phosphoribosyl 1,2-cyclic phosphodiesterase